MSSELALVLNGLDRSTPRRAGVLRVVLLPGDALRIPQRMSHLRVLTGTAWITQAGRDSILAPGQCYRVRSTGDCPVISGLRGEPLLVEVR